MVKPRLITLLGAESTGKSQLAAALQRHWQCLGHNVVVVSEYLREWCEEQGRTPMAHEQAHIAHTQTQRIALACASSGAEWVVADTSALMTAVYSQLIFQDASLLPYATHALAHSQHVLLMGLDLAWTDDGFQRDGAHMQAPTDQLLRQALHESGTRHSVIYGQGDARLKNAVQALVTRSVASASADLNAQLFTDEPCEHCSDPRAEKLLSRWVNR